MTEWLLFLLLFFFCILLFQKYHFFSYHTPIIGSVCKIPLRSNNDLTSISAFDVRILLTRISSVLFTNHVSKKGHMKLHVSTIVSTWGASRLFETLMNFWNSTHLNFNCTKKKINQEKDWFKY